MEKDTEKQFKVFNSFAQQTNNFCWTLDKPESTMSLGSTLTKIFPDLRILLLNGPLGAGKTTLVKGIAKSLKIQEPITSPTFPLSQHYPLGSPPLVHLDLYRIEEKNAANEFFLQEEEESKAIGALMVVEWPEDSIGLRGSKRMGPEGGSLSIALIISTYLSQGSKFGVI